MVLGDNIFYGNGFSGSMLREAAENAENGLATIFWLFRQRSGTLRRSWSSTRTARCFPWRKSRIIPKSNYCITGLYFYDKRVCELAKQVKPSARGELEITTLNDMYLQDGTFFGRNDHGTRSSHGLDTGTMDSLDRGGAASCR